MRKALMAVLLLGSVIVTLPLAAQAKKRGERYRITQDDISEAGGTISNAYDAVRTLRPQWLNAPFGRNASSNMISPGGGATEVVIYIDDNRQPSLEALNTVKVQEILELKFLEQNRAVQVHGPGHELGAIEITTIHKKQ
jgi:hypothetical protein